MPPRAALQRLWLGFRFFLAMSGPMPLVLGIRKALEHDTAHMFSLQALLTDNNSSIVLFIESASFSIMAAVTTPTNRGRLHRYLGSLGKAGTTKEAEAAAIAALVGGLPPERALDLATERFRALPLGKLTEEDVLSNSDTGLFGKTSKCALGECDAFVSHSWHDPGPPKLDALHTWAAGEPKLLWLEFWSFLPPPLDDLPPTPPRLAPARRPLVTYMPSSSLLLPRTPPALSRR